MTAGSSRRLVAGAIAMATIAGCGLSLTTALLAVRLDAAGYSAGAIGINTAAGGVAALACAPLVPVAARRLGISRVLVVALGLGGLALLGFTLTTGYAAWLALRFVVGLSATVLFVLSEYWIATAAAREARGLAIGLYATSLGIGFATGPLLLAAVGTTGDLPFLAGAALFWVAIVPLALDRAGPPLIAKPGGKPFWLYLREAPDATLAGMLHGAIEVAGIGLLPVYALRAGIDVAHGAVFVSLFVLGASVFQVPIGLLSDRVDRGRLLLAIGVLGFSGALALAVMAPRATAPFEALLLVWGGIVGGFYPVGLARLGARYRDGDLAGANAAFVMTYSIGMLFGPPFMGLGLDLAPPGGFFYATAVLVGLYLAVLAATPPRPARETESFS